MTIKIDNSEDLEDLGDKLLDDWDVVNLTYPSSLMKHIKYKDDSPAKEEEKIPWPKGKAGEKEK